MKSTIFATALMMLAYAADAKAQDKVRITVIPPENGTITVSPQLPPDCMVERGTKLTIRAAANKLEPKFTDEMPLSLEEIFIYEMEVLGYDSSKLG